jgi:hypothetical protein
MKLAKIITTRRWFRFSLRTLFLVITVFAVWLGYYFNWIRERHQVLEGVEFAAKIVESRNGVIGFVPPPHAFPLSLTILGEQSINAIAIPGSKTDPGNEAKLASFARLFPEADVICKMDVIDDSDDAPRIGLRP